MNSGGEFTAVLDAAEAGDDALAKCLLIFLHLAKQHRVPRVDVATVCVDLWQGTHRFAVFPTPR